MTLLNKGKTLVLFAAVVSISAGACTPSDSAVSRSKMRGLWVECQGSNNTLSTKKKLSEMINKASSTNMNAIFLQVHRGNRAWFRSSYAEETPYDAFRKQYDCDLLNFAIDQAHARGLELHAWVNIYRILQNTKAPVLKRLGRSAVTCDGKGKSLLSFSPGKLPDGGYWLDPGDPRVSRYLQDLIAELVKRYPKLDGVHLDFVRYPPATGSGVGSLFAKGTDLGYGPQAIASFKAQYGLNPLTMKKTRENCARWDDWRRDQVTHFVRAVGERIRKLNPKARLSAAVFPDAGRAYGSYFQDWRRWMQEGLLDFVVPMNYTIDSRMLKYRTKVAVNSVGKGEVIIGLGAYLLTKKPDVLISQIRDSLNQGADGVVLFSYDAMLKRASIFPLLRQRVFSSPSQAPITKRKQ